MKKSVIAGIVAAVIAVGGIVTFVIITNNQRAAAPGGPNGQLTPSDKFVSVEACNVLTNDIAMEVLGEDAKKASAAAPPVQTDDLIVSNCIYSAGANSASLLVRAAKTPVGADSNLSQFSATKPTGIQEVSGVGDRAFYNPEMGQLNILEGNNWYVITNYKERVGNTSLEANKSVAEKLDLR